MAHECPVCQEECNCTVGEQEVALGREGPRMACDCCFRDEWDESDEDE